MGSERKTSLKVQSTKEICCVAYVATCCKI